MDFPDLLFLNAVLPEKLFIPIVCILMVGLIVLGIAMYCDSNVFLVQWGSIIGAGAVGIGIAAWLWKLLR